MLTLNDGRTELWQWDTGRKLTVDTDCAQVHFSNKVFGRSIDVDVVGGVAIIPDILLQTDKELNVWAFVGTAENGYTKISKTFKVNRRNKPADYVFTPPDQTTLGELKERLDKIEESQADAIKNAVEDYLEQNPVEVPVESVNGKTGKVKLTAEDVGAISQDDLQEATNEALAQAKESGEFDGASGVYVGSGDMPEGYNVQIDPEGDAAPFFEEATVSGSKNLCHLGTVTFERGSGYLEIGSTLEAGKTYTLSAEVTSTDTDSSTGLCAIYLATSANVMMSKKYTIARGSRASVTFVCPRADISKIVFYASGTTENSAGDTATFAYIQIEEGSEATYFVPAESVKVLTAIDYVARKAIDDNIAKTAAIVTKTRWLAIGDSITFGVYSYTNGETSATGVTDGWVRRLADALGYDITVMASRGMGYTAAVTGQDPEGGTTRINLDTLLTRIEALVDDFNLITVAFGINDYATISQATLETIDAGLDDAIQRLTAKFPAARLAIITPFNSSRNGDASTNYAYGYSYSGRSLRDIADRIKTKCEQYGVECIYASNGFLLNNFNISTLLPDNTHPSDYGHTLIAKNMARYLLN